MKLLRYKKGGLYYKIKPAAWVAAGVLLFSALVLVFLAFAPDTAGEENSYFILYLKVYFVLHLGFCGFMLIVCRGGFYDVEEIWSEKNLKKEQAKEE